MALVQPVKPRHEICVILHEDANPVRELTGVSIPTADKRLPKTPSFLEAVTMQRRQDAPLRCCVFLLLVLCAVTGCNRRRAAVPPITPVPVPVSVPIAAPLRAVAILASNGDASVAAELARILPRESYKVTLVDVETEASARTLESLRRRTGLVLIAIGLPAARVARDRFSGPVIFSQVFSYQELLVNGRSIR